MCGNSWTESHSQFRVDFSHFSWAVRATNIKNAKQKLLYDDDLICVVPFTHIEIRKRSIDTFDWLSRPKETACRRLIKP